MAISNKNLAELRRGICKGYKPSFDKTEINGALNAVNDWWATVRASAGTAIETASPGKFTNAQKKKIVAYWFNFKFDEDK